MGNIRIVNNNDIVPILLEFYGYSQSGTLILVKDKTIIYEEPSSTGYIKNMVFSIIHKFVPFIGNNFLFNHLIGDYVFSLKTFVNKK